MAISGNYDTSTCLDLVGWFQLIEIVFVTDDRILQ